MSGLLSMVADGIRHRASSVGQRAPGAAALQMLIQVLPQIAKEVAAPIAAIGQLTIVSTDGAGALPKQVNDKVVQTLALLKTSTGLDLEGLVKTTVDGAVNKARGARVLDGHEVS